MKYFALIFALISWPAFAGFNAYQGVTSLGVVNKLACSTGTTCTKSADKLTIVSNPAISASPLSVTAGSGSAGLFDIIANNNLVNGDDWEIQSTTSEGGLKWLNNLSGSLVQKMLLTTAGTLTVSGGITGSATNPRTMWHAWAPSAIADATSTTPSATTVYLTQIQIPVNTTVTGIQVLNGGTVGTNKYIVALYSTSGTVLVNSSTAGVLTSGASVYQQIPFTAPYSAIGPATYWVGLYVNGTTDRFEAIPAMGQADGLAGTITGQTFGVVSSITVPTTFTAGAGAVVPRPGRPPGRGTPFQGRSRCRVSGRAP